MAGKPELPGLIPPSPSSRAGHLWVQHPSTPRCYIARGSCGGGSSLGTGAELGVLKLFSGSNGDAAAGAGQDGPLTAGAGGDKPDVQKYHPSAEEFTGPHGGSDEGGPKCVAWGLPPLNP